MKILEKVKEFIMGMFKTRAEKEFQVTVLSSQLFELEQRRWLRVIKGKPDWLTKNVRTINFAAFICYFASKKACMDLRVKVEGSERADYINACIKAMVDKSIRDKVEDACGLGGIILKPSGTYNVNAAIDYVLPGNFVITEKNSNGDIRGIIFFDRIVKGKEYYTRLEYQHFENVAHPETGEPVQAYMIENRAFKSKSAEDLGAKINLADVPEWEGLEPSIALDNVEKALFGYFRMPRNNTIDYASPEGVSIFAGCMEELKNLDVAWSRKANEVDDSQHITFIDEASLTTVDQRTGQRGKVELPRFVKGIKRGKVDSEKMIDEHTATLLTTDRIKDINSILSMISTKMGFSQGQFVMDAKTGHITATQIESDDNETIETITDIRTALKAAVRDLIYALDVYCDVYFDMPSGYVNALDADVPDEDVFYFKDLLSTFEQDRARAYQLVVLGAYSKRKYLKEYEGFSDDEVDQMMQEIAAEKDDQKGLFEE